MNAFAVVLLVTFLNPNGQLDVHAREIKPWRKLTAIERCERLGVAYLTAPQPQGTDMNRYPWERDAERHAHRRNATCIKLFPGGKDA